MELTTRWLARCAEDGGHQHSVLVAFDGDKPQRRLLVVDAGRAQEGGPAAESVRSPGMGPVARNDGVPLIEKWPHGVHRRGFGGGGGMDLCEAPAATEQNEMVQSRPSLSGHPHRPRVTGHTKVSVPKTSLRCWAVP